MNIKTDARGRKTIVDEDFVESFYDYYASMERHFEPMLVPTRTMTVWAKPKLLAAGLIKEENVDNQVIYRMLRQFIPGKKRFNQKKYGHLLEAYREKHKRIATFATHETLNLTGKLMRDIEQRLLKDESVTMKDLIDVVSVHLAAARQIQAEERENRKEKLEVADKRNTVTKQDIEDSAKLLNLLKS